MPPPFDATWLRAAEFQRDRSGRLNQNAYRLLNAWYDGGVHYADYCAGRLLDAIHASGRAEHAMIVIMSDHGELLGERGIVGHTWSVLDPVARIPLIIQFAGERSPTRCRALAQTQDVFATVLAAAGVPALRHRCMDLAETPYPAPRFSRCHRSRRTTTTD
jgi:arylsulfatase A-like enzyme